MTKPRRLSSEMEAAELRQFLRSEPGQIIFEHFKGLVEIKRGELEQDICEPGLSRLRGEVAMLRAMLAFPKELLADWRERNPMAEVDDGE